jgi:hypothetical protein
MERTHTNNKKSEVILVTTFLGISLILWNMPEHHLASAQNNSPLLIHGGGRGNIVCVDGSTMLSDISFIISSSKSQRNLTGNWTLNNFADPLQSGSVVTGGPIYGGSANLLHYNVTGETHVLKEKIRVCNPALSAPISIEGVCGRNVIIDVGLKTDESFDVVNAFYGDAVCQR